MRNPFAPLANWLDHRTGYRHQLDELLNENIEGGARWRYVTGSMLVVAFVTQVVTGVFLWMCYSPSSQTAWESVYFIQNEMQGGWILRGVHHFMAQAMVILLPIHMLQVVIDRAYIAPREINFWSGMILALLVLGLGFTGYLLPWDQKGYWATKVGTNLMSLSPLGSGAYIQKLMVGGPDYGHHTLTRFFALHAGVLPALLALMLILHVTLFRRHGPTTVTSGNRPDQVFWPYQVLKDGVAGLLLLVLVVLAVIFIGAEIGPPADPAEEYSAARPEWYYLFLFQLLKKFQDNEFLGAIVVPGLIVAFLFIMPILGRWKIGHFVNVVALLALIVCGSLLTVEALYHDNYSTFVENKPEEDVGKARYEASEAYLAAVDAAHHEFERVDELIEYYGIPKEGAVSLIRNDPEIQGPRLFRQHCASCHSYLGIETEIQGPEPAEDGSPTGAPNLYGFGSRDWLTRFLDPEHIITPEFFGNTRHKDDGMMVSEVESLADLEDDEREQLQLLIAAISEEAKLVWQEPASEDAIADGIEVFDGVLPSRCADCHFFKDFEDDNSGPDLNGYGSYDWLTRFIANPEEFYIDNDRMPKFAENDTHPEMNQLTAHEIDMLVRWIRRDEQDLSLKLQRQKEMQE